MPIIKVHNSTEKYKKIAIHSKNNNELTGRGLRTDITKKRVNFVKQNLVSLNIFFQNIIDVGCGDGSFLNEIYTMSKKSVGIIPTEEELIRLRKIFKKKINKKIDFYLGKSNKIPLKDNSVDLILCNCVLHGVGFNIDIFKDSLKEFSRVQKINGILYIGELPQFNEMKNRNYGTSFFKYSLWVLKNRGIQTLLKAIVDYLKSLFGSTIYVIQPTNMFFIKKNNLLEIAKDYNYKCIYIYDSTNNKKLNLSSSKIISNRLDYIFVKITDK